jgi:hypothetical protein
MTEHSNISGSHRMSEILKCSEFANMDEGTSECNTILYGGSQDIERQHPTSPYFPTSLNL